MMQAFCTGIQHVGIPSKDVPTSAAFYKTLGFDLRLQIELEGNPVVFLALGNLTVELYTDDTASGKAGAVDHIAIDTFDVEACYKLAVDSGLCILTEGIQFLPFWEKGIRYFTVEGPNAEKIEFSQHLCSSATY